MNKLQGKYLLFKVDEEYAIELDKVTEIIEVIDITRVPETPEYISGIINLRGHVLPVIDVRKRFRKMAIHEGAQRCIIIAMIQENPLGLIVDTVLDLVEIAPDCIRDSPQVGGNCINAFVKAIGIQKENMYLIIDTDRLGDIDDLFFLESGEWVMEP